MKRRLSWKMHFFSLQQITMIAVPCNKLVSCGDMSIFNNIKEFSTQKQGQPCFVHRSICGVQDLYFKYLCEWENRKEAFSLTECSDIKIFTNSIQPPFSKALNYMNLSLKKEPLHASSREPVNKHLFSINANAAITLGFFHRAFL